MPGLLLCFVLRYDAYKKSQGLTGSRLTYFHCSLLGYFLGLLTATVSSEVFKAAQPALLYLVPFTLLPLLTMAYLKVSIEYKNKIIISLLKMENGLQYNKKNGNGNSKP